MQLKERRSLPKRELILVILAASLIVSFLQLTFYRMSTPELDALRYVDYALNIHDHGVFGVSNASRDQTPLPGNANSPLYPNLLALAMRIDSQFASTLRCVIAPDDAIQIPCPSSYRAIIVLQDLIVIAILVSVWGVAWLLFNRSAIAWGSAALTLASTKLMFFANHLLTEILVLFFFAILMYVIVALVQTGRHRWWFAAALALGFLTLTRPEYLYLGYFLIGAALITSVVRKRPGNAVSIAIVVFTFYGVVGPWMARNHHHFGSYAVTGGYSDIIIAYRAAYNRMSWSEWSAAFIYWLPAHGEHLAKELLSPASFAKLGTDEKSYLYVDGRDIFNNGLAAVNGEREQLTTHLIKTEVLAHPFRHLRSSIPLAWRGILAGKYLAVAGVPCFALLLGAALLRRDWTVIVLLLPAIIMVTLYAAVSVSIPRYNVYLIYYYSLAVAWSIASLFRRELLESTPRAIFATS